MKKFNCILLVDDDNVSNYLNDLVISEMQIANHTHSLQNGMEAMRFIENHCLPEPTPPCPDLILLDIKMPVMNGFEFLEKLQEVYINKEFRVIILSSSSDPKDKEKTEKYNVAGYIHKPLSAEKLKQYVN